MKENIIEFYIRDFEYLINPANIDLDFIPPLVRRRMSKLDKIALSVMNKCTSEDIEYIVFSSAHGECERLFKIIEQYLSTQEVSPAIFSGSVHNYPAGLFLLNSKNPIPYNAVCSDENSVSAGILTSVISNYNNILFCYADNDNENFVALALNITKISDNFPKYIIKPHQRLNLADNFTDYADLFSGSVKSLQTDIYEIVRLKND